MEDSKRELKKKMVEGKSTGLVAKDIKDKMKVYTQQLEQMMKEMAMKGEVDENGEVKQSPETEEVS